MRKNRLSILTLFIIIAMVVCNSCARKEAAEETTIMNITIVNKTGETARNISVKEMIGTKNQVWETSELENGGEITMTINTVVEKGASKLEFSYEMENGNEFNTIIFEKGDKTITLKLGENNVIEAEIITK